VLAARNAPDEYVLSGDEAALSLVRLRFRSVRLATDGAWHSPAMAGAVEELERALRAVPRAETAGHLVLNHTGRIAERNDDVPSLLAAQLVWPIDWVAVLRTLRDKGVERFVTVGPGKFLRGSVRRTLGREVCVLSTETPRELDETMGALNA
jgi:[acyl-carrier-protein] S-malonyltransferase